MVAAEPSPGPVEETGLTATVPGERSFTRLSLRPLLRGWLGLTAEGVEHVPAKGPVLVASTHRSHADSVAIAAAIRRPVHFLGDRKLTEAPLIGPQLTRLGMIPLRRGEADADALELIRHLLEQGACVAVYPEGSRSRDGYVHRLRSGVARLAAETRTPVVPTAVLGIEEVWPVDDSPRLRGGSVTVRFAPVVPPPDDTPRSRRAFNLDLQRRLAELAGTQIAETFSAPHGGSDDPPSTGS
ncbi:MAG: lysophospholipid acyltransferase family protein [Nitriliruptoraceae bacterium]